LVVPEVVPEGPERSGKVQVVPWLCLGCAIAMQECKSARVQECKVVRCARLCVVQRLCKVVRCARLCIVQGCALCKGCARLCVVVTVLFVPYPTPNVMFLFHVSHVSHVSHVLFYVIIIIMPIKHYDHHIAVLAPPLTPGPPNESLFTALAVATERRLSDFAFIRLSSH